MAINTAFRNSISLLEKANQFQKGLHLLFRRYCAIEIANKADSYPISIGPIVGRFTMSSGNLLSPAKRYLNLAITAVTTIAYNKIVANPFPMLPFSMPFAKYSCISVLRR